jgi:hypothetical protein
MANLSRLALISGGGNRKYSTRSMNPPAGKSEMSKLFQNDSTITLIKKLCIYKMMGSNLFIKHALTGMNLSYKLLGIKLTNFMINKTAGDIFTAGETIETLKADIEMHRERNIGGIGNLVVEGSPTATDKFVNDVYEHMMVIIDQLSTEGGEEGHFAVKLSAIVSTDLLRTMSEAQEAFTDSILQFPNREYLSEAELKEGLVKFGVEEYSEADFQDFVSYLKFKDNDTNNITKLEVYANGHLFNGYTEGHEP